MFSVSAPEFRLADTLESGQAFRWHFKNTWYYGFIPAPNHHDLLGASCPAKVKQDGDTLTIDTIDPRVTPELIRHYFALDLNLSEILASVDTDAQIHDAIAKFRGLRILRQDPWECLASFICSSFNNIKRIEGMIDRLTQAYGVPVAFNGFRGSSFPSPEAIARTSERRLRELGLGFRASYLRDTAKMIAGGKLPLETLARVDYHVTRTALLRCDGVGEKVADCVALFGFQKYEAFPIDVWMQRAMRYYFRDKKVTYARMQEFAWEHFGKFAGYAQQYLYHYVRTARAPAVPQPQALGVVS